MDRERAEVWYRPLTMHLVCPEIAPEFSHVSACCSEGAEVVHSQAISIHASKQCQVKQAG